MSPPLLGSEDAGIGSIPTAAGLDSPGVAPGASFLSAIYAAGLADDPDVDNLFSMPNGNLRFPGDLTSGLYPGVAFFEGTGTSGHPGGAWYTRRYYSVATTAGTIAKDQFVGYDPAWGHTIAELRDLSFRSELVQFTSVNDELNIPGTAPNTIDIAAQRYLCSGGFNFRPVSLPTDGGQSEQVRWLLSLRNNAVGSRVEAFEVNSWGQALAYTTPLQAGITASFFAGSEWGDTAAAANNGVGVFFGRATSVGYQTRAAVDGHMLSSDSTRDWGLGFWASVGAADPTRIGTLDWTNGFVLNVPFTPTPGTSIPATFVAAAIDYRTPGFYPFNTPAIAGKSFVALVGRLVMVTRDAALTTAPTILLAQNGGDVSPSATPSTATINASAAPANYASLPSGVNNVDMTTFPLQLHVSVAAAGAGLTTCTGYFVVSGIYV